MKENKFGAVVISLMALFAAFGLGYFAGHTAERNTIQIQQAAVMADAPSASQEDDAPAEKILTGPININTADAYTLEQLPGIGSGLAERIIAYRSTHGAFRSIEEIKNVDGIGDGRFEQIRYRITTGG